MVLLPMLLAQAIAGGALSKEPPPDHGWTMDVDIGLAFAAYMASGDNAFGPGLALGFHADYRFRPAFALGAAVLDTLSLGGGNGVLNLVGIGPEVRIYLNAWTITATPIVFGHSTKFDSFAGFNSITTDDHSGTGLALSAGRQWPWRSTTTGGFVAQITYVSLGTMYLGPTQGRYMLVTTIAGDIRF
jgi:hypothetical protein